MTSQPKDQIVKAHFRACKAQTKSIWAIVAMTFCVAGAIATHFSERETISIVFAIFAILMLFVTLIFMFQQSSRLAELTKLLLPEGIDSTSSH